jgi:hypothetical protein
MVGCTQTTESLPDEQSGSEPEQATPAPLPEGAPDSPPIVDSGARPQASGTVEIHPEGFLVYTVAEGDVGGVICDRLGRKWWQLETIDRQSGFDCLSMVYGGMQVVPTTASWEELVESDGIPEF